jgi:iron complex outermembrane receptor protein
MNTNGVDLSANYRLRTKDYGNFTFAYNGTWVHKYEYQNFAGDEMHNKVGVYSGDGPIFRWQNTVNVNWSQASSAPAYRRTTNRAIRIKSPTTIQPTA